MVEFGGSLSSLAHTRSSGIPQLMVPVRHYEAGVETNNTLWVAPPAGKSTL